MSLIIDTYNPISIQAAGAPEGAVNGPLAAIYTDTNTGTRYLKSTSSGNTGWQSLAGGSGSQQVFIDPTL